MALVITGLVSSYWLLPLMDITYSAIKLLLTPLALLLT
jgi:hypothetical protein